jgi:2-oxo-4-hydroxy-4-carboxy-5-ureidoimidazoline decarboxylase
MTTDLTIEAVNRLDRVGFVAAFGDIVEHSPFVADAAFDHAPFADGAALIDAFQRVLLEQSEEQQLAILRAHPDLAGRAALAGTIAPDSRREQAGVGLDTLTPEEFARFSRLNDVYRSRFGIPFIFAVKGATKHQILESFETRIGGTMAEERLTALAQVLRIVRFRFESRGLS